MAKQDNQQTPTQDGAREPQTGFDKPLERLLRYAQKMESIGALAREIAHDFNNIIGVIRANVEMLEEEGLLPGSSGKHNLEQIEIACQNASALVRHMQTLGKKTESGKEKIRFLPLLQYLFHQHRDTLPSNIRLRKNTRTENDLILAEPTQIQFLLMHFVRKALHALDETGGAVEFTVEDCEIGKDEIETYPNLQPGPTLDIRLDIRTTPGARPEPVLNEFIHYLTSRQYGEGSGLGLAIIDESNREQCIPGAQEALQALQDLALVHGIIKSHHGALRITTLPEEGICLRMLLPLQEGPPPSLRPAPPPPSAQVAARTRILFIDDEEILAGLVSEMLQNLGYEVECQLNPERALVHFRQNPESYDLIITDQSMPEMSGIELATRIRDARHAVPVILCSGYDNLMSAEEARQRGIHALVHKPINLHDLDQAIREAFECFEENMSNTRPIRR